MGVDYGIDRVTSLFAGFNQTEHSVKLRDLTSE